MQNTLMNGKDGGSILQIPKVGIIPTLKRQLTHKKEMSDFG